MELPVLLTPPGSELVLPPELGLPAGSTWRLIESLGTCLFVALASADTFSTSEPRTLVLCWDSDLVHFLESPMMSTRLHALQHIKNAIVDGKPVLWVREVVEIWRGVDTVADDAEVIVFKTSGGASFCGMDGIPLPASVRLESVIAAVGQAASLD